MPARRAAARALGRAATALLPSPRSLGGAVLGRIPALPPHIPRCTLVGLAASVALLGVTVPVAAASRTVYATSAGAINSVTPFPVAVDGSISPGIARTTGSTPKGIAMTPDGARLFVANAGGTTISAFDVDPSTGALAARPAVDDPAGPAALAITPDGTLMFAANPSGSVSAFTIDQFGNLNRSLLGGATLTGTGPDGLAVSPDGLHLFVAEGSSDTLAVLDIGAGGTLTSVDTAHTGAGPAGVTVSPNGSRVYVANAGGDDVSGFTVSPSGALAAIDSPPYSTGGATGITIAPDGRRLLVTNPTDGSVTPFLIDPTTGALDALAAETGLPGATGVTVSPDGKYAYVGDGSHALAFNFGADATVTQRGLSFDLTGQSGGVAITPNQAPYATFEPVPSHAGSATKFLGTLVIDTDGSVKSWHWDFGDGGTSDEISPEHVYAQVGSYTVRLTVVDNEGCSTSRVFTGQTVSCAGGSSASQSHTIQVPPPPDTTPIPPPCQHVGNDGFCGTPDQTAPKTIVLGLSEGASITTLDAPDMIVGTIANDPSGIQNVKLRFTKAAGFVTKKKKVRKLVCHKVKGRKKKCARKTVTKKVKTSTALCLAPSGTKNYLVSYVCSKAPWISIGGTDQFRWSIPVALSIGSYTVDVIATDGAGNADTLEAGRNHMSFKIIKTPSNSDSGAGTPTTPPTTTTTAPIDDTGSPFGH
jgi:DNA-binding beta-propeller fold protein YncE/PKD repeat protein